MREGDKKDAAQLERFAETARKLECDEDQEGFEDKLRKIAKAKLGAATDQEGIK